MDVHTQNNYLHILDLAARDPEYLALVAEYRSYAPLMTQLLYRLPEEDADIILDHAGVVWALGMRLLEISCGRNNLSE